MFRVCVSLAAVACSSALIAQNAADAMIVSGKATVKVADASNRAARPPVAPLGQTRLLSDKAPAGISAPQGAVEPWFGTLEAGGRNVAVVFGKQGGASFLFVDRNVDGKFGDGEKLAIEMTTSETRGATVTQSKPVDVSLAMGGNEVSGTIAVARSGDRAPSVSFQSPSYLEAAVEIDGAPRIVAVVDEDFDGTFGSEGDAWILTEPGAAAARIYNLNAMSATSFDGGKRFGVEVSGDTIEVKVIAAEGPDPVAEAANRQRVEHIWHDRFDLERADFVVARGVDTSRPRDKDPIQWNYVTFEEGLAMAKKSGKLLFADDMAFWCVWCYRLDYYTYPDDEVAMLMKANFIPVKIIDEQNRVGDYRKVLGLLETTGIPAMGIFDGDGNLVHKIGGWKSPAAFVSELNAAISKR